MKQYDVLLAIFGFVEENDGSDADTLVTSVQMEAGDRLETHIESGCDHMPLYNGKLIVCTDVINKSCPNNKRQPCAMSGNGRVPMGFIPTPASSTPFERTPEAIPGMFQRPGWDREALSGIKVTSEVARIFFCKENVEAVHQAIRYSVWKRSCEKHVIGRQSEDELKIIMRSIYLQHAKDLPYEVHAQVRELNGLVIDWCVDRILGELELYMNYTRDINQLPIPMEHGQSTSLAGTKVLEVKRFI